MNRVIMLLFLGLMISGCTTTKTIIEYRDVIKTPDSSLLTECIRPFDKRPSTFGEAVNRDEVWRLHFDLCNDKIKANREFHGL